MHILQLGAVLPPYLQSTQHALSLQMQTLNMLRGLHTSNAGGRAIMITTLQQSSRNSPTCSDTVSRMGGADVIHPEAKP